MGGMMGQTPTPTATANSMLPYYGVFFAVIIAVTIVGVIGVAYYLVYPQIRMGTAQQPTALTMQPNVQYSLRLRVSLQNPNRRRTQNHHRIASPRRQIPAEIHQNRNGAQPTANTPHHRQIIRTRYRYTGKDRQHQPSVPCRLAKPKSLVALT